MATSNKRWIDSLQFSSLFQLSQQDDEQWDAQVTAYVELFSQITSEHFPDDLAELIRSRYPCNENTLFDDVLDGLVEYDRSSPPFASFISQLFPERKVDSEQLALARGEILRILTYYNTPIHNRKRHGQESTDEVTSLYSPQLRPLSPWITDILLQAPLSVTSDYFRWCAGVAGTDAATQLKPPSTSYCHGSGKHPLLKTATPRWAVTNGAAVIISVCNEEVARYKTATLTGAAVPAVLLPPVTAPKDAHHVAGQPTLEPYACLFHRYYAFASPSMTQKLLLGLLEAPPSWTHYALEAAVQLMELLRAAEDCASSIRLPRNWMYLHFLRAIGTAISKKGGTAAVADAAAALLFRILSQPSLLFPSLSQFGRIEVQPDCLGSSENHPCILINNRRLNQLRGMPTVEATAQGISSMLCADGPEVERRLCMIWETAFGLIPLSSSLMNHPETIFTTSLQPPILSWSLCIPLLKVLEYLPRGSPSESCLMKIFAATVEAVLQRTFSPDSSAEQIGPASKSLNVAELHTIVHSLFLGSCASVELASRLLFVALTVCIIYEAQINGSQQAEAEFLGNKQRPMAAFDSYVIAAVCALSCELQTNTLISKQSNQLHPVKSCAIDHTRRMLAILEALLSVELSSTGTPWSCSSNEIVASVMVAAHISHLFRRSKTCMRVLSLLMRRNWDKEIKSRASSLFNLIDTHHKTVASIVDRAKPLEASLLHGPSSSFRGKKRKMHTDCLYFDSGKETSLLSENLSGSEALDKCEKAEATIGRRSASFPTIASALGHMGFNCREQVLRSVLADKKESFFLVVSLLWNKLIALPEIQPRAESTSAQQGWRKVVDALSNVVSASPAKAAIAIVLQADSELKPWFVTDDEVGQEKWRINQRIVTVIAELMSDHENSEALMILASASDLLFRATDGIHVNGEACTLPQLELLEAAARAVRPVLECGESGLTVADGISNLLKRCLPMTVCCASHPSAHVRALSMSVLRSVLQASSMKSQCSSRGITELKDAVEKCLIREACSRLATGLPIQFVEATAKELGCTVSISDNLRFSE